MTPEQMLALRCAYADLQGSAQARLIQGGTHDWKAHNQSIADLEREFPFLVDRPPHKEITEDEPAEGDTVRKLLKTVEELFAELNSAVYALSSLNAIQRVEATLERARQVVAKIEGNGKEITEGHIFKAASLYLCSWPDDWTEKELLARVCDGDRDIFVCEAHEMQPWDDIAQWIEDAARAFS